MKLKEKRFGKEVEIELIMKDKNLGDRKIETIYGEKITAKNFSDFFEDHEPKEYYYICHDGEVRSDADDLYTEDCKLIGNYFPTIEEAELAVEKLKAIRRLKDKDIKVIGWHWIQFGKGDIEITLDNVQPNGEHFKDLDLLFGGKE